MLYKEIFCALAANSSALSGGSTSEWTKSQWNFHPILLGL